MRLILKAVATLTVIHAVQVSTCEAVTLRINLQQYPQADGTLGFRFAITNPIFPFGTKVYMPDGTEARTMSYPQPDPSNLLAPLSIPVTSYEVMSERLFGTWTIQDSIQTYTFAFAPVPIQPVPVLVSPVDGSTVSPDIPLQWEYSDGYQPGGSVIFVGTFPNLVVSPNLPSPFQIIHRAFGPNTGRVVMDLGSHSSVLARLHGGGSISLTEYVSPITTQQGLPTSAHEVIATFSFFTPPVFVTVVPEPSSFTLGLGAVACLAFCCLKRRTK